MTTQTAADAPQSSFLRPLWSALLGPPWLASMACFAVIAAARFVAVFSPYPLQELYFVQAVAMGALPFVLLTADGRKQIGLTARGATPASMLFGLLAGCACAAVFFLAGMALFGTSPDNWCISIRTYLHFEEISGLVSPLGLFGIYAIPAVFLNPIGEEFLFRGVIQQSFARRIPAAFATLFSSLLFGLVYLSLHGVFHDASGYHLRLPSAAIAVCLMACVGATFSLCRARSGSLWPAVAAHAAFNLTLLAATILQYFR